MKHESPQSPEVFPTQEILAANQKIEDMVGQTDIDPAHLARALAEAQAVYNKYENVDGDEDFDVALDILLGTIQNTRDLEHDVMRRANGRAGVEDFRDAA